MTNIFSTFCSLFGFSSSRLIIPGNSITINFFYKFSRRYGQIIFKYRHIARDYQQALARLELIFHAKKGTSMGDELEILGMLVDNYENDHFPIGFPDPIEAIKFSMEQLGYSQSDLASFVGLKSRASEI